MLHGILERVRQKKRTAPYPDEQPRLPDRFRGLPRISASRCHAPYGEPCDRCLAVCPTEAIRLVPDPSRASSPPVHPVLDMGLCLFCGACAAACPQKAITFSGDHRLAATRREDLLVAAKPSGMKDTMQPPPVTPLETKIRSLFSRSLRLREVSAAGCNACEADCNVLGTIVYDLPRFGIDFVASPRHADALVITGPAPDNMRLALEKCFQATPDPKLVIAVGTCAISGGLFRNLDGRGRGLAGIARPNLLIPGCPPHPYTILDGLLRLLGRIPEEKGCASTD